MNFFHRTPTQLQNVLRYKNSSRFAGREGTDVACGSHKAIFQVSGKTSRGQTTMILPDRDGPFLQVVSTNRRVSFYLFCATIENAGILFADPSRVHLYTPRPNILFHSKPGQSSFAKSNIFEPISSWLNIINNSAIKIRIYTHSTRILLMMYHVNTSCDKGKCAFSRRIARRAWKMLFGSPAAILGNF